MVKTFYEIRFKKWGSSVEWTAWFDNRSEALDFSSHVCSPSKPRPHTFRSAQKIEEYQLRADYWHFQKEDWI